MSGVARRLECAALALGLVVIAAAIGWRAGGGTFYAVGTASMGTTAPVGSLVLDRPARALRVGELITFHAPGTGRIFTHRVFALTATGAVETKGDVNSSADAWQITRRDVVGQVAVVIPYLGWVLRALPILAIGIALVGLASRWLAAPEWRSTMRASGIVAVVVLSIAIFSPLIDSAVIVFARGQNGAAAAVVSTGVLPVRVMAIGGSSQTIGEGQVAHVMTTRTTDHRYELRVTPDWQWWWIGPLALLTVLPGLLSVSVAAQILAPAPELPWSTAGSVPPPGWE